jgi:hypothetical protein
MPAPDIAPICAAVDAVESIQITGIDIAVEDVVVDVDVVEAMVDVGTVAPVDKWP